jgi:3-hydroxypropanoate dehydrogenase
MKPVYQPAVDLLFLHGRSPSHWLPTPVPRQTLHDLYELLKFGPTSMNCQPLRLLFVGGDARARLAACVNSGNEFKVRQAPVVAILGQELAFPASLARLFPHKTDALKYYEGKPEVVAATALRNSSLQGAYLIMAARLLGLDCGPMSGFNTAAVDAAFWAGTTVKTNFLCCLGHGDVSQLKPRQPRLAFDEVCRFVET